MSIGPVAGTGYGGPPISSLGELALKVATDQDFAKRLKENPAEAIRSVAAPPLQSDAWIYRMVVAFLGFTVLVTVVGLIVLAATGKSPAPEGLVALGSAAVGALAGLLAPSPASTSKT